MPSYDAAIEAIEPGLANAMRGVSWHDDPRCPAFEELAVLRLPYTDFNGQDQMGRLVVSAQVAADLVQVFAEIFAARYPIFQMKPICELGGDDTRSMSVNNCSAFNFRVIAGTERLSKHALGRAVDINPVQNPWVRDTLIAPPEGAAYLDRSIQHPALLRRPHPAIDAFDSIGWQWGGDWTDTRDYHHFSAPS